MATYSFDKVEIHGFRGLKHLQLDELGLVNLIVGGNNSGKTSVLEAMSILCDPFNPSEWLSMIHRRDFGGLDENRVQSLRWCFEQKGELSDSEYMFSASCDMRCDGRFPLRHLIATYRDIVGEPDPEELKEATRYRAARYRSRKRDLDDWLGSELVHNLNLEVRPEEPTLFDLSGVAVPEPIGIRLWEGLPHLRRRSRRRQRVESETLTPYSYQINQLQVRHQSQHLFISERRNLVLDLVRQFDPEITDVVVGSMRGGRPAVYLKHRRLGPAPLSVFGDALRRAVLLAGTIPAIGKGGVLLLDELETGIHVSALDRVFSWLIRVAREWNIQVVATTHSLEAVDAIAGAAGDRIADLVTFHLRQLEDQTEVKRIAGDLLFRLRHERGLDVR